MQLIMNIVLFLNLTYIEANTFPILNHEEKVILAICFSGNFIKSFICYNILKLKYIKMNIQCNLSPDILAQQHKYLTSNIGLYNLFDMVQVHPPFIIPENSLVVELTNITFGPNRYTVVIPQTTHQNFRIIYYSLLFYIFQKNPENKGTVTYQNLLRYILSNNLSIEDGHLRISDEEVKTYLLKFLDMLKKGRCKNKIIGTQLCNLPQIDLLFIHLIKQITKQSDLMIQRNASIIQQKIKQQLEFDLQFLNNQTFIFQFQFIVDIRLFNESCQFYIRQQNAEVVNKIKIDIMLQESAHFMTQQTAKLDGSQQMTRKIAKNIKVTKKSTIKSIQWMQQSQQQEQNNKKTQQEESNPEKIEKNKLPSFLDKIPFVNKKENSPFGRNKTIRIGLDVKRFQLYNQQKHNFGLSYSDNFTYKRQYGQNLKKYVKNQNLYTSTKNGFYKIESNKSFIGGFYGYSSLKKQIISPSYSTKCIKTDGFASMTKMSNKQIRIPSFIINRAKEKRQLLGRCSQKSQDLLRPKITFVYKNN